MPMYCYYLSVRGGIRLLNGLVVHAINVGGSGHIILGSYVCVNICVCVEMVPHVYTEAS